MNRQKSKHIARTIFALWIFGITAVVMVSFQSERRSPPDPDSPRRKEQVVEAAILPSDSAIPALTAALIDPSEDVQCAAARSLGSFGPHAGSAVGPLATLIDNNRCSCVSEVAIYAIRRIGSYENNQSVVNHLVSALGSDNLATRFEARKALNPIDTFYVKAALFWEKVFHAQVLFGRSYSDFKIPMSQIATAVLFIWLSCGFFFARKRGFFVQKTRAQLEGMLGLAAFILFPGWDWIVFLPPHSLIFAILGIVLCFAGIVFYSLRDMSAQIICPLQKTAFREFCGKALEKLGLEFEEIVEGFLIKGCDASLAIKGAGGIYSVRLRRTKDLNLFNEIIAIIEKQLREEKISGPISAAQMLQGVFGLLMLFLAISMIGLKFNEDLPSVSAYERRENIRAASLSHDAAAINVLTTALHDESCVVQQEAATLLGELGPRAVSAVPALEAKVSSDSSCVRQAATKALQQINGASKSL